MKRNKVVTTLGVLGGITAVAVGGTLVAPSAQAYANHGFVRKEYNPEIDRAIRNLQDARVATQRANRDFGGHRAKAAQLIDQAIVELRLAKRYDNRN